MQTEPDPEQTCRGGKGRPSSWHTTQSDVPRLLGILQSIMDDAERRSPYPKPLSQRTAELAPVQRLLSTSTPPSPSPPNTQKRPLPQNFQLLPPRQRGSPALARLNKPRGRAGEQRPGRGLFPFQPEQAATPVSPEKPGTVCFHFSPRRSSTATPVTGAGRLGPLRPRTPPPPPLSAGTGPGVGI